MKQKEIWVLMLVVLVSACGSSSEKGGQAKEELVSRAYVDSVHYETGVYVKALVDSILSRASAFPDQIYIGSKVARNEHRVSNQEFNKCYFLDNKKIVYVDNIDSVKIVFAGIDVEDKFDNYDTKFMYRKSKTNIRLKIRGAERVVILEHKFSTPYASYLNDVFPELYMRHIRSVNMKILDCRMVSYTIEVNNKNGGETMSVILYCVEKPVVD